MEKLYEYVHEKFRHLVTASNQERIEFLDEPQLGWLCCCK